MTNRRATNQGRRVNSHAADVRASIRETIEQTRFFANWPTNALDKICAGSSIQNYAEGQILGLSGDQCAGLWVVKHGMLTTGRSCANGRRMIFDFLPPGQLTGFIAVFDGLPLVFDVTALTATSVVFIPRRLILDVVQNDSELLFMLVLVLCRRTRIDYEHIFLKTLNSPRVQLAKTILYHTRGTTKEGSGTQMKFSQEVVAALLGLSRQTVNKELAPLIRDGILKRGYRSMVVLDQSRLVQIANSEEPLSMDIQAIWQGAPKPYFRASV